MKSCQLSTRSSNVELAARTGDLVMERLLAAEAGGADWRIVELSSQQGQPFEAHLQWTSGHGVGSSARITVAAATRVCVCARTVQVRVGNLSTASANRVTVTVADGYDRTENVYEVVGTGVSAGDGPIVYTPIDVDTVPFGRRVRLETSNPSSDPVLRIYDGAGVVRALVKHSEQPPDGTHLGGARLLQVTALQDTTFRLVFTLAL